MDTEALVISRPLSAIVMFGLPSDTDGFHAGVYYQCVIDPNMVSPSGDYIRFDQSFQSSELHGWQRIEALTVCEVLTNAPKQNYPEGVTIAECATVTMRAIARG